MADKKFFDKITNKTLSALPTSKARGTGPLNSSAASPKGRRKTTNRPQHRILVVDDEDTMRRSLADILRLEGHWVQTAGGGQEAIRLLDESRPGSTTPSGGYDLILLDLKMPDLDGLEVLRFASRAAPDTQVILLTAHGSLESAIEALRQGAHDYLLKPSSPEQIVASVVKGLARRDETTQKRTILNQLDQYVQALKSVEEGSGDEQPLMPDMEAARPGTMMVIGKTPSGVLVRMDLMRREIWLDHGSHPSEGDDRAELAQRAEPGRQRVTLTPTEAKLIKVLVDSPGRVFSHRELVSRVQGYETTDWEAPEVLRPLVSRLRRKLAHFPDGERWVVSVRGTGYVFDMTGGSAADS